MKKFCKITALVICLCITMSIFSGCLSSRPNTPPDDPATGKSIETYTSEFTGEGFSVSTEAGDGYTMLTGVRISDGAWVIVIQYPKDALATTAKSTWDNAIKEMYPGTDANDIKFTRDGRNLIYTYGYEVTVAPLEHMTLKFWGGGTQWEGVYLDMLLDFVDSFNAGLLGDAAKDLNITIEFTAESAIEETLVYALSSKSQCPNLVIWDRFVTPTFAYEDRIMPIDNYVAALGIDLEEFVEPALEEMRFNTRYDSNNKYYYGLPIDVDTWGIYINLSRVRAHNQTVGTSSPSYVDETKLKADWTWNEYLDIARKLSGTWSGTTYYGATADDMQEHYFKYMTSTGKDMLVTDENGNLVTTVQTVSGQSRNVPQLYTGQEADDVLNFFNRLYNAKSYNNPTQGIHRSNVEPVHFYNGTVAMYTAATYFAGQIERYNEGQWIENNDYIFLPQPKYCGEDGSAKTGAVNGGMIGGFSLIIPKLSSNLQDQAYLDKCYRAAMLMDWWARGEGAEYWSSYVGTLPAVTRLHTNEYLSNPTIRAAADYVVNYKARPNVVGFQSYQTGVINPTVQDFIKNKANNEANRTSVINTLSSGVRNYMYR